MLSDNPKSGIYEAETARTLDLNGGSPACNQGGMAIVETYRKTAHPQNAEEGQGWEETAVNDMLNVSDNSESRTPTLVCQQEVFENHSQDTRYRQMGDVSQPISATFGMGGNNQPFVVREVYDASRRHSYEPFGDVCETVQAAYGTGGNNTPMVAEEVVCIGNGQCAQLKESKLAETLNCMHDQQAIITAVDCRNGAESTDVNGTLQSKKDGGYNNNSNNVARVGSVVRRLTPLECERLQGFPDGWTDIGEWTDTKGKKHKEADSCRYKALGNSIALPFWKWMAKRMAKYLPSGATMASLFDGIGGFPLSYTLAGVEPIWASEIEEFPIAVTKRHFGEGGDLQQYIGGCGTTRANGSGGTTYGLDRASFNQGQNAKFNFAVEEELAPTVVARGPGGVLTEQ